MAGRDMGQARQAYSDFLPRFRALIELGNWSEGDLRRSLAITRAVKDVYTRTLKDPSEPRHDSLRKLHEKWWLEGSPGEVRVYRFTTQYQKPGTYKVWLSCDDDHCTQYFWRTTTVYNSSDDLGRVACSLVAAAIDMF